MYEKGLIQIATPLSECEEAKADPNGFCYNHDHSHHLYARESPPLVYLPHSCDEWVIGGPDEVRAMIEDLRVALAQIEAAAPAHTQEEE